MRLQDLQNNTTQELAEGYGKYYCSTDKKWKERLGPKQTREGVAEGGFKNKTAVFSGYSNYMRSRAPNVFKQLDIKVLNKEYFEDEDIIEYTVISDGDSLAKARATLETNPQFGGMVLKKGVAEGWIDTIASKLNGKSELEKINDKRKKLGYEPLLSLPKKKEQPVHPAYDKGFKARAEGWERDDNPYLNFGSSAELEWDRGWVSSKKGVAEVSDELRNRYVTRASDDYSSANFAARASKSHPGLDDYSKEQEQRAKKRAAGLNRALSDKRLGRDETEVDEASLATMRDYYAGDENAKDPTKLSQMRDFFNKQKPEGRVIDKHFNSKSSYEAWLRQQKMKKISGVNEDDKTDRMVQHIIKSEKAAGKSVKDAEDIAWATVNKRGMLESNEFAEPVKSALGQAIVTVEGMRSVREGEPGIKRVTRKRVDDSVEVRYHVLDSDGVTRKVFDDLANAKAWLSANRPDLHKD